jgi:hypothetical protein
MATLRLGLRVVTYPRKCKRLGTSLPCSADRGRRRAVRIGESVESPEGAFAEWHGYALRRGGKVQPGSRREVQPRVLYEARSACPRCGYKPF